MPVVPWPCISASPDIYYNTNAFVLPCSLVAPDTLTLPDIYLLAPFFIQSSSSPNLFHFQSKSEILCISASKKQSNNEDGPAEQDVERISLQVLGNGTTGNDDSPEHGIGNMGGDEDVRNNGGDDDDGVSEGSRSGDSGVGDQQVSSKVVELDDVRHTLEPRGGNTSTAKLADAGMVPDSSEATTSNDALVPVECEGESRMCHYLVHNIYLHNLINKRYNESWARSFSRS